jgi:hypothetical protein
LRGFKGIKKYQPYTALFIQPYTALFAGWNKKRKNACKSDLDFENSLA